MLEEYNTLGKFVITQSNDSGPSDDFTYTSSDGINWATQSSNFVDSYGYDVSWSPDLGLFLIVYQPPGSPATAYNEISSDGINWTSYIAGTSGGGGFAYSTCWSKEKGIFVNAGLQKIGRSSDGINFTWVSVSADLYNVRWSKERNLFIAVGEGTAAVVTSPDGANWTTRSSVGGNRSVCYSSELDMFLIGRVGGGIFSGERFRRSTDGGITWQNATTDIGATCWSVVWVKELTLFIAATWGGIWTSPDGDIWTNRYSGSLSGVDWSPELALAVVTGDTDAIVSSDGINWTPYTLPGPSPLGYKVKWAP
jgi:hypothetical protein